MTMTTNFQKRRSPALRRLVARIITITGVLLLLPGAVFCGEQPLTLQVAYESALQNNENIQMSRETVNQAELNVDTATSNLYPQLTATGSHVREKELYPTHSPTEYELLTIEANQHIYQLGKVWTGREMAKNHLQGSRLSHERSTRQILFQVSAAYYNVLLGRRSVEIAESALERANKQLERASAQFEVGVLTRNTVLRAEVQVAQAVEQLERARNQYLVAKENLALEMGIRQAPETIEEPENRLFPAKSLEELIETAMQNRRDLKKSRIDTKQADKKVDWEKADFFPKIFLHGEYQRTTEDDLFYDNDENWSASLNLSYPLFTGGKNRAELGEAKSAVRQAKWSHRRMENEIRNEVRRVYLDLQTQRKVLAQNRAQVKAAQRNYQQVTAQFEEGLATAVDQVDAFTALNEAENRLANAHYTHQLNLIKLKLATGTFHKDLILPER
ncbi:MAG: TolC family protein [Thermodesulfobacteriota bacterium]|nr:TolC family protein [Thermodesulfobacteriota bacterium]